WSRVHYTTRFRSLAVEAAVDVAELGREDAGDAQVADGRAGMDGRRRAALDRLADEQTGLTHPHDGADEVGLRERLEPFDQEVAAEPGGVDVPAVGPRQGPDGVEADEAHVAVLAVEHALRSGRGVRGEDLDDRGVRPRQVAGDAGGRGLP